METPAIPGGGVGSRPLHLFFALDVSGSMDGRKVDLLNKAMRDAIPALVKVADDNPQANLLVDILVFNSSASWITREPIGIRQFTWSDLRAGGETHMGEALQMIADRLDAIPLEKRLPPVVFLISDGEPTDNFYDGLQYFMSKPWGKKSVRIAMAVECRANSDAMRVLSDFIGTPEIKVCSVDDAADLGKYIKTKSTQAVKDSAEQNYVPVSARQNNNGGGVNQYANSGVGPFTPPSQPTPTPTAPANNAKDPSKWVW